MKVHFKVSGNAPRTHEGKEKQIISKNLNKRNKIEHSAKIVPVSPSAFFFEVAQQISFTFAIEGTH
jgi:hypothetical protein